MSDAEQLFHQICSMLGSAAPSQLFGKKCYKSNGKAFVCLFQDCMVFKLTGTDHLNAMTLPGAKLFDPSGKGKPMKEWVQLPFISAEVWSSFARSALNYAEMN